MNEIIINDLTGLDNNFTYSIFDGCVDDYYLYRSLMPELATKDGMPIFKRILTHSGQFHADEVFAIALIWLIRIELWNKQANWYNRHVPGSARVLKLTPEMLADNTTRTGLSISKKDYEECLCIDLLNGHFDHHMDAYAPFMGDTFLMCDLFNEDQPLAALGSLWAAVGRAFDVREADSIVGGNNVYRRVYESVLKEIDLLDCYGPKKFPSSIGLHVSRYNDISVDELTLGTDYQHPSANFYTAVLFAYDVLRGEILRQQKIISATIDIYESCNMVSGPDYEYVSVKATYEESKEFPLEALELIRINESEPKFLFNRNKSSRDGTYRLVVANSSKWLFNKKYFDEPAEGQTFMHKGRFMVCFDTLENAENFIKKGDIIVPYSLIESEQRI